MEPEGSIGNITQQSKIDLFQSLCIFSLVWIATVSGLILLLSFPEMLRTVKWFGIISISVVCDFFLLAQLMGCVVQLVTKAKSDSTSLLNVFFWGTLKVAAFGVVLVALVRAAEAPKGAIFLGLGTLLVVPLATGLWWNKKEASYARAD